MFELEIEKRKTQINRKTSPAQAAKPQPNPLPSRPNPLSSREAQSTPTLPLCWARPLGLPPHPGLPRSRLSQRLGPARHLRSTARSLTRTPAQPPASYRLARGPRPSLAHLAAAVSRPPAQRAGLRPALLSLPAGPARQCLLPPLTTARRDPRRDARRPSPGHASPGSPRAFNWLPHGPPCTPSTLALPLKP